MPRGGGFSPTWPTSSYARDAQRLPRGAAPRCGDPRGVPRGLAEQTDRIARLSDNIDAVPTAEEGRLQLTLRSENW